MDRFKTSLEIDLLGFAEVGCGVAGKRGIGWSLGLWEGTGLGVSLELCSRWVMFAVSGRWRDINMELRWRSASGAL